jgi:hypothetical protein
MHRVPRPFQNRGGGTPRAACCGWLHRRRGVFVSSFRAVRVQRTRRVVVVVAVPDLFVRGIVAIAVRGIVAVALRARFLRRGLEIFGVLRTISVSRVLYGQTGRRDLGKPKTYLFSSARLCFRVAHRSPRPRSVPVA